MPLVPHQHAGTDSQPAPMSGPVQTGKPVSRSLAWECSLHTLCGLALPSSLPNGRADFWVEHLPDCFAAVAGDADDINLAQPIFVSYVADAFVASFQRTRNGRFVLGDDGAKLFFRAGRRVFDPGH